jgi:hypothetical protein
MRRFKNLPVMGGNESSHKVELIIEELGVKSFLFGMLQLGPELNRYTPEITCLTFKEYLSLIPSAMFKAFDPGGYL